MDFLFETLTKDNRTSLTRMKTNKFLACKNRFLIDIYAIFSQNIANFFFFDTIWGGGGHFQKFLLYKKNF